MTYSQTSSRPFILALLLALALLSPLASAFPPDTTLGDARESPGGSTLTIAGQTRVCSEYPDETGIFSGSKTIKSSKLPALVNVYQCTNNDPACDQGWKFLAEYEADTTYRGQVGKFYAYEVYHCPSQSATCENGETRPVTETTFQTCRNGGWGPTQACSALQYFDPQEDSCVFTTCKERWTCGQWGQCTADGSQYRSCEDLNRCGTFKGAPKTQLSCTPVLSDGTVSQGAAEFRKNPPIRLVGKPTLDRYATEPGESVTVTQEFEVFVPGTYWVEAGVEQVRGFSVADVPANTCDPSETWYANQRIAFSATGKTTRTFTVTPTAGGEWALHTAIVTGCGGEVLEQQNAVDRLEVTSEDGSTSGGSASVASMVKANSGLALALLGLVLVVVMFIIARRRRGKR